MSLITPKTNPAQTIVYSKNGCVKCNQTKTLLKRNNIPFLESGMEMWCDFQPNKIKELKSLLEIN